MISFRDMLEKNNLKLKRKEIETVQINVGKKCNQACSHCHVNGGPNREEIMDKKTMDRILELISKDENIKTIDITGGAPELNSDFRYLVSKLVSLDKVVLNRCNLTVLYEKGQEDTAEFLAEHKVQIMASLPCYLEENVDFKGIIIKNVDAFSLEKLEAVTYLLAKKEFKHIEIIGAILGALIGFIQFIIGLLI